MRDTPTALAAERAFLAVLDGSCRTPIAGHATVAAALVAVSRPHRQARRQRELEARAPAVAAATPPAIGADAGRELKRMRGPGFFDVDA